MPSRHDLSPLPPSSTFSQSTPALSQRPPYLHNASSSSPPNDLIATPSDRYDSIRGAIKQGKQTQRRSVRIRSSSGGNFDSSPQIGFGETHAFLDEKPVITELSEVVDYSRPPSSASLNGRPRGGGGRPSAQHSASFEHYSQPHASKQYEDAKPQLSQYSYSQVPAHQQPQPSSSSLPPFPAQRQPQIARTSSTNALSYPLSVDPNRYDASTSNQSITPSTASFPYAAQAPLARTPNASSALQRATFDAAQAEYEQNSSARTVRSRPSFEDVMQRSAKRRTPGSDVLSSQVMQWAQEDETSSSSEDEGPGLASLLAASAQSRRIASSPANRTVPTSASKLLPSPVNFDRLGGIHEASRSPSLGQDGGPRRGIMDRFMSDRPNTSTDDSSHAQVDKEQIAPPESPPRRANYAQHLLASPVPSKPSPSVLFSPDVAKLLRSELDQLEANEVASGGGNARRPGSPLKNVDRSSDIVVDSSPMQPNSPFSSGGAARTRDVFGNGADIEPANKRARWTHVVSASDNGLVSPTSSSASAPLRAPSFCDSSPASSEHGSVPSRLQPLAHPASAPDYVFGSGPPSSSPTSSHNSDYVPARYARSSPGPSVSGTSNLSRSNSIASASGAPSLQVPAPAVTRAPKRTPAPPRNNSFDPTQGQQDPDKKPTWSYAALIGQAIFSAEDRKMSLADIYTFIMRCYPYYKKQDAGWQNSIRHNLSLNECFVKTARGANQPGKGSLWAIVAGCEEQFADGGFVKRGGAGNSRKSRSKAAQQANAAPVEPKSAARGQNGVSTRRNRAPSPTVSVISSRSDSISVHGAPGGGRVPPPTLMIPDHDNMPPPPRDYSPASISVRSETPLSPPPQMPLSASVLEFSIPPPPLLPRSASVASMRQPVYRQEEPRFTLPTTSQRPTMSCVRSYSTADLNEEMEPPVRPRYEQPMMIRTASAPVLSTAASSAASTSEKDSHEGGSPSISRATYAQLRDPLVSATMSPPTSVYHRLAGPYQPMYGASSLQNRRALALLASPEAAGIMPSAHPFDRGHALLTAGSQGSPRSASAVSFLPSPQIFPGSATKRTRTESDKEDRGYSGLLSPSTLVHTQSPISSVRGGPRVPMSPTQPSAEKLEPIPDPEKKPRAIGTRLLPAVNALVDASHDPFRSPPRTARTRSPSARGFATSGSLQAALHTPGKRPLGFSPSLSGGNWPSWNDTYSSSLDTELDHFNRDNMVSARSPWPSPAARLSNW